MSSDIEWLWMPGYKGEQWNPITGCTKTSPGCANCYAETFAKRFGRNGGSYLPGEAIIQFEPTRMDTPSKWRQARMVFINSVSDLFHPDVKNQWIDMILAVVAMHPRHIFTGLTKRPARMAEYFADPTVRVRIQEEMRRRGSMMEIRWPIPNLWLGTSVENQHFANERIPLMVDLPTPVRFLSIEPLLGPIDFSGLLYRFDKEGRNVTGLTGLHEETDTTSVDWMIIGGESGHGARPMHPDWVKGVIGWAEAIGVPVFFKQWGQYRPYDPSDPVGKAVDVGYSRKPNPGDPMSWPMISVGKGAAGHSLELIGWGSDEDEWRNWPDYGLRYG